MDSTLLLYLVVAIVVAAGALCYSGYLFSKVKKEPVTIPLLSQLSGFIHEGAMAFLSREYKVIIIFCYHCSCNPCGIRIVPSFSSC